MFSPDDHEQPARRTHAERDESAVIRVGFIIRDGDGVGIVKDRNRLRHADPMPSEVDSGFALFVPLEAHDLLYVQDVHISRRRGLGRGLAPAELKPRAG